MKSSIAQSISKDNIDSISLKIDFIKTLQRYAKQMQFNYFYRVLYSSSNYAWYKDEVEELISKVIVQKLREHGIEYLEK